MYLRCIFKDAFSLFNALCDFQNKSPYRDRSMSNAEQYRLLYDFSMDYSEIEKEVFKECLAFDFLKQGRNPSIPDFLRMVPGDERQYGWDFLSNQNNLMNYFPNYEGKALKDIMKDLVVRRFSFDIFNYMESGKIDHIPIIALFDYGSKNNSGQVYSLGLSL
jgi:hypothetical protein